MKKVKLISSNVDKIKEFKEILGDFIVIEKGKDIKEIQGNIDDVITYKSLDAGKDYIVEDTVLVILDKNLNHKKEIVDIRWKIDELKEGQVVKAVTSLGYNNGIYIYIFRGEQVGVITKKRKDVFGFGFDPYFVPIELYNYLDDPYKPVTLAELKNIDLKNKYSSRYKCLINFKKVKYIFKVLIKDIPKYKGKYQNE